MEAVLDPELLGPPPKEELEAWVVQIDSLTSLAADGFRLTSPTELRDRIVAVWYENDHDLGPASHDLARLVQELLARLSEASEPVLVDNVTLEPDYLGVNLDDGAREQFRFHIAQAAYRADQGVAHAGVIGPDSSWTSPPESILVESEILMVQQPGGGWEDPEEGKTRLREFIHHSSALPSLLKRCCEFPCALIENLKIGVKSYCVAEFELDFMELSFEIGPDMKSSLSGLNYPHDSRYAKSCIRTMALIVAGRTASLPGHIERKGEGPNEGYVRNTNGDLVIRTYLARKSPDAHRLFWVRTVPPIFLNVTSHEGSPEI